MSTVIKAENVSKQYRLGKIGTGSMAHDMNRWWHRMRGNEDPYLKIGEVNDRRVKGESEYVWALQDINFDVKQGEVMGIIGRNGAGKSTLLKILARTTSPTTGKLKIRGRVASLLEVGTGFHPELTGRENIFLNGAIMGMTTSEIRKKFDEIVDFAGVEKYIDTPVKRYSSGMYVRLAFGVAAHLEPEILIVDEVLAVGDAEFQKKALGKMGEVSAKQGRTILFVSHNLTAIKQLCSDAIVMNNGLIIYGGKIESAVNFYLNSYIKDNREALGTFWKKHKPVKSDVELLEAVIVDIKNNERTQFDAEENIIVNLKIAKHKHVHKVIGYLAIKDNNEEIYIQTDTFDYPPNIFDELEIGTHDFTLTIPKRVLPNGTFIVYLNFASEFATNGFILDSPQEILTFEVLDEFTRRGPHRTARTNSIIKWNKLKQYAL